MTIDELYDSTIKHLPPAERLQLATLILNYLSPAFEVDDTALEVDAIRDGIEAFERGEGRPALEALEELRQKYAIPPR